MRCREKVGIRDLGITTCDKLSMRGTRLISLGREGILDEMRITRKQGPLQRGVCGERGGWQGWYFRAYKRNHVRFLFLFLFANDVHLSILLKTLVRSASIKYITTHKFLNG
jgi:hypothetical protein